MRKADSASEDGADIIQADGADDMQAIEIDTDNEDLADDGDNKDVLADDTEDNVLMADSDSAANSDLSSGCSTSDEVLTFDIGSITNNSGNGSNKSTFNFDFGNSSFDLGGLGDMFGGMFGGSKDTLKCNNLNVYYAKKTTYSVKLLDSKGNPLSGKVVSFAINNKIVGATTNSKGVAKLKIHLKPGTYVVTAQFGETTVLSQIKVKNNILTKDVVKKYKKKGVFKIKIVDPKGKPLKKKIVKVKFNKKVYNLKTNKKGVAKFKLSKTLKKGKYKIKVKFNGLSKKNKITVK